MKAFSRSRGFGISVAALLAGCGGASQLGSNQIQLGRASNSSESGAHRSRRRGTRGYGPVVDGV